MVEKHRRRGLNLKTLLVAICATGFITSSNIAIAANTNHTTEYSIDQQKTLIKGQVKDASGEPVIGASILEKGTSNGTITDIDGNFSINVKPGATLQISYIGFKAIETKAQNNLKITLKEDSELLDEVVVVGYGAQKKENLTGAVASVRVDETLASRPIADVGRGLQGAVSGLTVTVPSGEVGSDPVMKIRGQIASIEGSSKPLILVDNVEIPSIQMINPDDIESISVLKDAASASIYGAKGAFGVILITTKKGAKTDKFEITYSSNFSWQNPTKKIKMAGIEGLQYTLDAQRNRGSDDVAGGFWRVNEESIEKMKEWQNKYSGTVKDSDPVVYGRDWYFDGVNKFGYRIYDGTKAMINDWTPSQTHNLSVNGKSGKTAYNIGLGYLKQEGLMKPAKHDDFKRYNASFNLSSELNKYISVRAGAIYSDRSKRYPEFGTTVADPWLYLYRWSRLFPVGVTERDIPLRTPDYETATTFTSNRQNKYYSVNLGTTITPLKDWDIRFDYTYSNEQNITNAARPTLSGGDIWYTPIAWKDQDGNQVYVDDAGKPTDVGGMPAYQFPQTMYQDKSWISRNSGKVDQHVFNIYSTYNLNLGKEQEHKFKFMVGSNIVKKDWESNFSKKMDLLDLDNPQFDFAVGTETVNATANWESQVGFFGRVNYSFADRYLVEANMRYDGTSKFPSDVRWRTFPSFSAGWVLSNESFMKVVEPVLSFAKIRGSWGIIGDQTVPNHLYFPKMNQYKTSWLGSDGIPFWGYGTPGAVARDITWQDIQTLDLGFDFRFYKNIFGVTFDWYQRDTKNMILPGDALPETHGTGAPKGNYGNLRTRGWELAFDFSYRFENGLGINGMASIADATTIITKGADHMTPNANRKLSNGYSTGRRFGDIYGYVTDRLYQKDDFVYNDNGSIKKTTIIIDGVAKETHMLKGENPIYQTYLEDGKGVVIFSPGDVKYKDLNGDGYITPGDGTVGNPGDRKVIGNTTPRYEYGIRLGADYKGVDFSIFMQGIGKREIWGSGQLAIPGYFAKEGAMADAIAKDYWREDRPNAFYPRAWDNGGSDTSYSMQVQSKYLLDMSYLRIKNITIGYSFPEFLLKKVYLNKARLYLSLENFFTFDNLRGLPIDPEAISGYSMFSSNYNLGRTGTGAPVFKSASFGVQLTF